MAAWLDRRILWWIAGGLTTAGVVLALVAVFGRSSEQLVLHDVTGQTGITFEHTDGGCGRRYIMETVSAGLALFDYNGDGHIDVYFLNGAPLAGCDTADQPRNALYQNDGAWNFTDVTEQAGVGHTGYGLGVAVGDFDNDGDSDVFLNNYGPNVLYENNGDGTFTDVTKRAGVTGGNSVGAGACFLDIDRDGDLDLYAAQYLEFSYEEHVDKTIQGVPCYESPQRYPPAQDLLYRNDGDGTFTEIGDDAGIGGHVSWGMGMVCADYDNDGDTDVFIGNDVAENFLFENDGTGKFDEVGLLAGSAFDLYGSPQGSMGVDCGDFDNDGLLVFYQTSYQLQHAVLFRNLGDGLFEDITPASGAGAGTYAHVTWGNGLVDFDDDGDRDIFVACGHLHDRVDEFDKTTSYLARNVLLMNTGDGHFVDVSDRCGDGLAVRLSSRGAAFDDLDNDGDVDAVILNSRQKPTVLRNDTRAAGHWIQVELVGVESSRDGVGARVEVVAGDLSQVDEVHSGRGYQSHYGSRLHFGLGKHKHVDRIRVRWMTGGQSVVENVSADRRVKIVQGLGIAQAR
jgi:hypothetical protein